MNRRRRAAACMLWVTLAACGGLLAHSAAGRWEDPREKTALVEICRVSFGDVEKVIAADGLVGYEQEYAVVAPRAGYVAQLCAEEGSIVRKGDLLARLDASGQEAWVETQLASAAGMAQPLQQIRAALLTGAGQASAQTNEMASAMAGALVRSPAEGVVQRVCVETMSAVAAGMPIALMGGGGKCVRMQLAEKDAQAVQKGMRARIMQDGIPVATGWVQHIDPLQVQQESGLYTAAVTLALEDGEELRTGALVEAEIVLEECERVASLPLSALTAEDTLWWVADGRCWEIPSRRLMTGDETCWVPMQAGTEVVVSPTGLINGQRVKEAVH